MTAVTAVVVAVVMLSSPSREGSLPTGRFTCQSETTTRHSLALASALHDTGLGNSSSPPSSSSSPSLLSTSTFSRQPIGAGL
ncbi:unnamed protein product [Protopolystoma xenopodis]|uniref:Uncharacterized protein n=1 Tax=Protopolystoma xenopodis TaxID=117903 RepID=A0A3S5AQG1_9PLAT|nr:unnamed protein product [Protopolystoma xenopodis]